jgi:heme oxygenase
VILGLAGRLRAETQTLHTRLERSLYMATLLKGQLGLRAYCLLLRNLHPVYSALESALDAHAREPSVAPLYLPRLFRAKAIASDLDVLWGRAWHSEFFILAPTTRYVERLGSLSRSRPALLGAHAYVRYLGDLSGGQLLKGILSRGLNLAHGQGLSFLDFGDAAESRLLANAFRAGLDAAVTDEPSTQALVDEAKMAFAIHGQLFDALAEATDLHQ